MPEGPGDHRFQGRRRQPRSGLSFRWSFPGVQRPARSSVPLPVGPPEQPTPQSAPPAPYRGPGTDLGEDIRRGYVTRSGDLVGSGPPAPAPSPREFGSRPWGERLRERWRAMLREGPRRWRIPRRGGG